MHPAKTCIELASQNDNSLTRHSERLVYPVRPTARNVSLQPLRRHPFHRCSSIAFCSTSSTTGPTSSSASRPTCEVSSLRILNSFTTKKHEKISLLDSFLRARRGTVCREVARALFSAARPQSSNHGHSMHRARPLAPSWVDLPSHFFNWRVHLAASLRKAHDANSIRRKRTRRPSCSV